MFKVGVIHRKPNQVSLVLVVLGGKLILQFGDFCLVLGPNVDTPRKRNKTGHRYKMLNYGDISYDFFETNIKNLRNLFRY